MALLNALRTRHGSTRSAGGPASSVNGGPAGQPIERVEETGVAVLREPNRSF
jgi:hypothetical protein